MRNSNLRPLPCGAPRTESKKHPGYADLKASLKHYRACPHPGCKERLEAAAQMGAAIVQDIRSRRAVRKGA